MTNNDFINGLCGGFLGTIVSHPFDTVKTRIQSKTVNNVKQAIQMGKLYAGIAPPLVGIMLEKSIVFGFYEKSKSYGLNNFLSGIIGGFASTVIVTPVDRLKINWQNGDFELKSHDKMKKILNPKNLYKGFTPTIFRETPGFGIYFSTYNYLKNRLDTNSNLSATKTFIIGALSGFSAWCFIYPSDLIKTRYQANNSHSQTLLQTIKNTWNESNGTNNLIRGCRNFYKGFHFAVLRAMPLHGGVFVGYELAKKHF